MSSTSQNSSALTKRPSPSSLMPPPRAPKRIKRPAIVLDEDTYTDAISHIIARDYYPGLLETEAQSEYLNALKSRDNTWIAEAGRKLTQVMTPGPEGRRVRGRRGVSMTPLVGRGGETPRAWGGETPMSIAGTHAGDDEEMEKKPHVDLNMTLSAFQEKYTSEDQESFNQLLDKDNAKRFEKSAWLHNGNKYPSKQRLAQQMVIEAKFSTSKEIALRPSEDLDKRPAAPNTHKHTALNSLMFNPESIEDWAPTRSQQAEAASIAPPKAVVHHNTRLPVHDSSTELSTPPSPTTSAVRDAISGRPRPTHSEAGYAGSETPRVNGYTFVDVDPDPEPEPEPPKDLLEKFGSKSEPSPFTIKEAGRRERLHHKMVERIGGKKSGKEGARDLGIFGVETPRFMSAPTPRAGALSSGGRKNAGNLTPAARKLYEKVGTPRVDHSVFGGKDKKGSWVTRRVDTNV
ncbi:hypothetical protein K469DRAFT_711463 [Zopfia rhizophila CBS 207.26]|uniref:Nuclear protein DGCR14 n=1 Tax=Zopfia rhizophila CBS 207.26 TaxID=1314779 RepID=A0A6A6DT22_9PEZI|nr:hypothetical protein K469DRAFT_711463 [Zopfia rhizophila CBS 207.26]